MKFSSSFTVVMKTSSLQLPSLAGTLSIKSMLQSAPKQVIVILKIQKFSEFSESDPSPSGLPHPPTLGACGASIFAPSALTHAPPLGSLATGLWAGPQPAQAPPCCTKCNSSPISGQRTNHRIAVYCILYIAISFVALRF